MLYRTLGFRQCEKSHYLERDNNCIILNRQKLVKFKRTAGFTYTFHEESAGFLQY